MAPSPGPGSMIDFDGAAARIKPAREPTTGSDSIPTQQVEKLSVGERQRVEIIKVLYRGAMILILDEPTAVLVPQEVMSSSSRYAS